MSCWQCTYCRLCNLRPRRYHLVHSQNLSTSSRIRAHLCHVFVYLMFEGHRPNRVCVNSFPFLWIFAFSHSIPIVCGAVCCVQSCTTVEQPEIACDMHGTKQWVKWAIEMKNKLRHQAKEHLKKCCCYCCRHRRLRVCFAVSVYTVISCGVSQLSIQLKENQPKLMAHNMEVILHGSLDPTDVDSKWQVLWVDEWVEVSG